MMKLIVLPILLALSVSCDSGRDLAANVNTGKAIVSNSPESQEKAVPEAAAPEASVPEMAAPAIESPSPELGEEAMRRWRLPFLYS